MKSLLGLMTFILISMGISAQNGIYRVWQNEITNDAGARVLELKATKANANGTVVVGHTSNATGLVMYLAKYQNGGQLQWDTAIVTTGFSTLQHVDSDSQGNYYAVGIVEVGAAGSTEIVVLKMSANGQLLWMKNYSGSFGSPIVATDMKIVGSNLYICGVQEGPQGFDVGWLAKYDLAGTLVWDNVFAPAGIENSFSALAIDNMGTVTVVGSADFGYSYLALQYNSAGTLNWQYPASLPGGGEKWLSDVAVDGNGNVYAIGTEEVGAFFEYDIVTLKFNNVGGLVWKENFNSMGENAGAEIRISPAGTIYSMGSKEVSYDYATVVIAYNSAGTKLWDSDYIIEFDTRVVNAAIDASGDIYVGIQDYDSLGVLKFSSSGALLFDQIYENSTVEYLSDISLGSNAVYATAYADDGSSSVVLSLRSSDLTQNFLVQVQGDAQSDARAGDLVNDGSNLWLSTFSDDGDTATFSITQVDLSGNVQWERSKSYKTSIPSFPYLASDGNGNIIGLFENGMPGGGAHLGLVKYNNSGTEIFEVLLDSASEYRAGGLAIDNANNIFIAGYNEGQKKMFLSKYSSTGVFQWSSSYTSPSTSFPYAEPYELIISPQGKLVMAAVHKSATNDNDLHVFQYSSTGSLEWHTDVDNVSSNLVSFGGMQIWPNGDISIFGSSGASTYVCAKFNAMGSLIWDDKGSTAGIGAPRSMAVDSQGKSYLCFSTNMDVHVRQLNAAGAFINNNQFAMNSSGDFYFPWQCGIVNDQLIILGEHLIPGINAPFEMLINDQLTLMYANIDSTRGSKIQAMTIDAMNGIYGVYTTGNLGSLNSFHSSLIRKYEVGSVGIDEFVTDINSVRIYPNPVVNKNIRISVDVQTSAQFRFDVFDLNGRKVKNLMTKELNPYSEDVHIQLPQQLSKGTYLLGITTENATIFKKILVLN